MSQTPAPPSAQNGNACNCLNLTYLGAMFWGAIWGARLGLRHHWAWAIVGVFAGGALGLVAGFVLILAACSPVILMDKLERRRAKKRDSNDENGA